LLAKETEEVTNYFRSSAGVFEYIQISISVFQPGLKFLWISETFSVFAEMLHHHGSNNF
jgi:hypothetical protein